MVSVISCKLCSYSVSFKPLTNLEALSPPVKELLLLYHISVDQSEGRKLILLAQDSLILPCKSVVAVKLPATGFPVGGGSGVLDPVAEPMPKISLSFPSTM